MGLRQVIFIYLHISQHFKSLLTIFQILVLFTLVHPAFSARPRNPKTSVICTGSSMTVVVDRSSFSGLHEDHLQLTDSKNTACNLHKNSNSTHIIAVIPLNSCGTQIEENGENLIFKNEITTIEDEGALISRKHLMELKFYCQYPKRGITKLGFIAHRENVTVWEKGIGMFTYQFEFYPDNKFQTRINPNSYPLEYDVKARMFMQIKVTSSANVELFVESCRAAPFDNLNYQPSYTIIDKGCKVDQSILVYSTGHEKLFRFSMEAFRFIGLYDHVYITCSVLVCQKENPKTRCSQGCIGSTQSARHRQKREAVVQSANHFISQGPLRLRREAESRITVTKLNPNLAFVAGCLLAAVGMICGVATYRANMSKGKYMNLSGFET